MMDDKWKRVIRNIYKRKEYYDALESKQNIRHMLDLLTLNGKIALCVTSVDCDMSKTSYCKIVKAPGVMQHYKWVCDKYDNAEGYFSWRFERPDRVDEYVQRRDLALEAFEDGHPHVVYM